jgi:hypothetical protein
VDASFIKEINTGLWGAVMRNDQGKITLSAWDVIPVCESAEAAESTACLEGVKHALMSADTGLVVESDCAFPIKKL